MPDFSYLDSAGMGQVETPFQEPNTLKIDTPGQQPVDFSQLGKLGQGPQQNPTGLFPVQRTDSAYNGSIPRTFNADRLIPYEKSDAFQKVGFNPNMPEDKRQAQYDYAQSNWEAIKSSFGDMVHITGEAFSNYFKTYGDTIKSLTDNGTMYGADIKQVEDDNQRARANLRFKGDIPVHWYNYIPLPGLLKGDVAEEMLPQLGFTIGTGLAAGVENLGVSLATAGEGEVAELPNSLSKVYKLISEFSTLKRGAALAKELYSGPVSNFRTGLDMWRLTNATLSETSLEGASNYVQHRDKLIQDFVDKNNRAPDEQEMQKIKTSADAVANETMWGEFPVLFASNWIQYRNMLAPNLAKRLAENEALKSMKLVNLAADKIGSEFGVAEPTAEKGLKGILHGASHFAKNATAEGLEETGQRFVSTSASNYEQDIYKGKDASALHSMFSIGLPDILSDSGLQEFMGGFITGGLFHGLGSIGNKLATLKPEIDEHGNVTGYKKNFLQSFGLGTEQIAEAQRRGSLQTLADSLNTEDLKSIFKEEGLVNLLKSAQDTMAMNGALRNRDIFSMANLKSSALNRFLYTGLETGKLDLRMDQLNAFKDQSQEKLNQFFGMDTGVNKDSVVSMIDHIADTGKRAAQIYDAEKERFADKQQIAYNSYKNRADSHNKLEQDIRTKYGFNPDNDLAKQLADAFDNRKTADQDTTDLSDDIVAYHRSRTATNESLINLIAVKEGRKAAVLTAATMDADSRRSQGYMDTMAQQHPAYSEIKSLLNDKDMASKAKELVAQILVSKGIDNRAALDYKKQLDSLNRLRDTLDSFYNDNKGYSYLKESGRKEVASAMYDYINDPHSDKDDPLRRANRLNEERGLGMILGLEKRNRDNLSLYNRLTTSDRDFKEYSEQETRKTADTITKWIKEYMDKANGTEPAPHVNSDAEQSTTPTQPATQHTPTQSGDQANQDRLNQIKQKDSQGQELDKEDHNFLTVRAAAGDTEAAGFYKDYLDKQAQQAAPTTQVVVQAAVVHRSANASTKAGVYIPEDDSKTKEDEVAEQKSIEEHLSPVVKDPNRTIVNEIPRGNIGMTTPKLYGGYTAWKQKFFDTTAQDDTLDRFSGTLVYDTKDNYPVGSTQYDYLDKNPEKAGIVLKIVDKNGNDRFDDNFLPSKTGNRIIHSLPNSTDKSALLDLLTTGGITEIPVDFSGISKGIFDELPMPRKTRELVQGISEADYQFVIAEGPQGEKFFETNGTLLRNGGLYIQAKASYIKLLPELSANLVVNGITNPDVYSLVGQEFSDFDRAKEIADFLETIFYTDRQKGGLEFDITKVGNKYQLGGFIVQNRQALQMSPAELAGALKARRININKDSIGTTIKFYHVVNGQIESMDVDYNQFLKDNTLTNKKAYETAEGKKVLKPVNRYLTFNKTLKSIKEDYTNNQVPLEGATNVMEALTGVKEEVVPNVEQKEEPNKSLTQEPTKSKRKRFDKGDDNKDIFGKLDELLSRKRANGGTPIGQSEIEWLEQRFGKQAVQHLKDVIDADAWGRWTRAGITIYRGAPEGTGYHEAWHHFSQLFLTVPQKKALYNEVRDRVDSLKGKTDLEVEEHVAEDFRKYVQSNGELVLDKRPERNNIFRRLLDFLKRFFGAKTNRLEGLYRDLYDGNLKKYTPSLNNTMFGLMNSKIVDRSGNELLNNQKSYRYIRYMDSLFGQILADGGITPSQLYATKDITRRRLIETYREMHSRLKDKYNELADRLDELEAKFPGKTFPISDTIDDLEAIIENFPVVAMQHRSFSNLQLQKMGDEDEESIQQALEDNTPSLEEEEHEEADNAGKGWDKAGNEQSVIDTATPETKSLLRSLSKVSVDKNGMPISKNGKVQLFENDFGLTEPVNFTQIFNNLGILLEGSKDFQEMLTKMSNRDNQQKYPELALILERLPKLDKPLRYTDVAQLVRFYQDFAKTYIPIYTLVKKLDGGYFFREETKRTRELIKREWSNNFFNIKRDSPLVKNNTILFDESSRPYISPSAVLDYNLQSQDDREKFLGLLGVTLNDLTRKSSEYKKISPTDLGYVLQNIRRRLKAGQKITNPLSDLSKEYRGIYSENKVLNSLLELEAKYSSSNPSMSYKTAEGNMQHGLSLNNWVTANNYWLSRMDNYSQVVATPAAQHLNIDNNPYIARSLFLNRLFNLDTTSTTYGARRRINGEPVTLVLGNYNGFKTEIKENKNEGSSTTSLNPREKIIMDLNALLVGGAVEIMRTESSASAFFVKLSDYSTIEGQTKDLPILPQDMEGDVRHPDVINYFLGAFKDELATIANKFNSTLPGYNVNVGKFTMFEGIIGEKAREAMMDDLKDVRDDKKMSPEQKQVVIDKVYDKYVNAAADYVGAFLDAQVKDFQDILRKQGITGKDISTTLTNSTTNRRALSFPEITSAFIVNDLILNSEFSRLFAGNLGFYKAYHKRSKGDTSTGIIPATDGFIKDYLETNKSRTLGAALGADIPVNLNESKTLVYKDDMRQSVYTTGRNAMYKRALKSLNPGMTNEEVDGLMDKSYGNMTVADGQGHATLDFYREMRIRVKNWSYEDEVQYQKEVIGFKRDNNLYTDEADRLRDDKFMIDQAGVTSTFPPMKMQYNGPLKAPGTFAPVLDKFSIVPLIPSVVRNTNWEDVNKELLKAGIGYTKFESGTKKYKFPPVDFYSSENGFTASMADIDVSNPATHFAEGLKEQIATNSKVKEESPWGTQMRKLFLANLFNSGIASDKFTKILDNYVGILNKVQDEQKGKLYKEFGITEEGPNIKVSDVKNFVQTLQRQVETNNLNDNIKDFIRYDKDTKSFVYPLEISLNKAQVQDLISGMIFKKLTRLKINGDMLIQVASSGYEQKGFKYTNATQADIEKYGTNGLPFYEPIMNDKGEVTGTKAMRVKVALVAEWTKLLKAGHPDGQDIGTVERLNELLKDEKWREQNRKKISMIGYRIPTQGPNSMEFMEVHEFLPSVAGSIVILPAEIVAKAGSDYDIDKMNIFRPSFTPSGELISEQTANAMEERASALEAKYQDLLGLDSFSLSEDAEGPEDTFMARMLFPDAKNVTGEMQNTREEGNALLDIMEEYKQIKDARTKLLTNQVMDLYRDVLSSPEMFTQLVTPNNVLQIKPVAEELAKLQGMFIGDFKNTDVIKPSSNWVKFEQLLSGKRDIGIFARANTMSQLLQQTGMNLNEQYGIFETIKGTIERFDRKNTLLLLTPEERDQMRKTIVMPDGSTKTMIDYSANRDVSGVFKQEYFSELMNSTVDIAADPYYMAFGLTADTIGAAVHMLHQGIPFRRTIMFINQPIVKAYMAALRKEGNQAKWDILARLLNVTGRGSKARVLNKIEAIDNSGNDKGFYFNEEELRKNIEKPGTSSEWYGRKVLAHFLKSQEQGKALRNLQDVTSFDTTKFLTPVSAQNNIDMREEIYASGLFDKQGVDRIMNHSMISPFNSVQKNIDIFSKIMPTGMNKQVIEASASLLRNFRGTKKDRIRLERTLSNDWIEFIVKNFATIGDENFEDYASRQLVQLGDNHPLALQLIDMKNKYPALNYYDAFRRLYPNFSDKAPTMKNIELYRGIDSGSDYQNVIIEELAQLMNFKGNEVPGATFTEDQTFEIRDFFKKLGYLAFQQSGFNKGPLFFTDVIPHQELSDIFREGLRRFNNVIGSNPQALEQIISDFTTKFIQQNPNFGLGEASDRQYWRGKFYKIDDQMDTDPAMPEDPNYVPPTDNDLLNNIMESSSGQGTAIEAPPVKSDTSDLIGGDINDQVQKKVRVVSNLELTIPDNVQKDIEDMLNSGELKTDCS